LAGHFIKTISQKINITYTDFIDSTFTGSGNSIMIDEQQASEISFIWCNFTNLRIDDDGQISSCIHSILSSENGFQLNAEYCIFSDCTYNGSRDKPYQKILNSITELNYTSKPVNLQRTIYILDDIWDETLQSLSLIYPLVIKSGLIDDDNGNRKKDTWITNTSAYQIIYYRIGDLTA
ncbi:MAG: hypothetical protein EZS28_002074, partial [Streblomastix strix]